MFDEKTIHSMMSRGRQLRKAVAGDKELGKLAPLAGTWANLPNLGGRGWNMIALPFEDGPFRYRLLMNRYNEVLSFFTADKGVPNRGLSEDGSGNDPDQVIIALDYEQKIDQVAVDDFPPTGVEIRGGEGKPIHHEPGLFLNMLNRATNDIDIARLGTIPHGDSVLALGKSKTLKEFDFDSFRISGLPIGLGDNISVEDDVDPDNPSYLDPYKHYHNHPFDGLFEPVDPMALIRQTAAGLNIKRTTVYDLDTMTETAGIVNIPFIVNQANATEMRSVFWVHELDETDEDSDPKMVMQYFQIVMLDFFPRRDGVPGLIKWPHISINTMERVKKEGEDKQSMIDHS